MQREEDEILTHLFIDLPKQKDLSNQFLSLLMLVCIEHGEDHVFHLFIGINL
jgi:hypothetical protein